jgi:hypothetical protein
MNQYEQFITQANFELAFQRLKTAQRNLYKSIYYEDLKIFELFLDQNIASLINNIKEGIYKPSKSYKIFIPKKDNLVRPLSMLIFSDLLVYQAIINIIADVSFDMIAPAYNKTIFGNVVNTSFTKESDKNFFYKPWKKKWKKFNEISKQYYEEGYIYLSEFDIASFFDTIDHNILCELLANEYKVETDLYGLLSKCLEAWTADSNNKSFKSKHGIPQGPLSSPFLADLYLFHLDTEINKLKKLDFKYIRYVDDIRIFAKDSLTAQKLIAALDLISRDLGLIPQGSKILIKEITDIEKELKLINSKFSEISKEYQEENEGKPSGSLKSKTHKRLKKRFIDCFDSDSEENYLDKSVIGFSLYKLNKDEKVKNLLLEKYPLIITQFEGVLYYLKRHFSKDTEIKNLIKQIINDENILFHHLIALVFKYFPETDFDEKIYNRYAFENHRHWLVNYYMVSWLFKNGKKELILADTNEKNHFIQRELNNYKFISSNDKSFQRIFSTKLLESKSELIALQGLYLLFNDFALSIGLKQSSEQNDYVKYILTRQPQDLINFYLKTNWNIAGPETFFNKSIWFDDDVYDELRSSFLLFVSTIDTDPSKALLNLNAFNNLIFDKICKWLVIIKPAAEYGSNLNAKIIESELPYCNRYWMEINEKRNQKTEAHPYDKFGNIRLKITHKELLELIEKERKAIDELCNYRKTQ